MAAKSRTPDLERSPKCTPRDPRVKRPARFSTVGSGLLQRLPGAGSKLVWNRLGTPPRPPASMLRGQHTGQLLRLTLPRSGPRRARHRGPVRPPPARSRSIPTSTPRRIRASRSSLGCGASGCASGCARTLCALFDLHLSRSPCSIRQRLRLSRVARRRWEFMARIIVQRETSACCAALCGRHVRAHCALTVRPAHLPRGRRGRCRARGAVRPCLRPRRSDPRGRSRHRARGR